MYRAQIRIKRAGEPEYSESRTFGKKSLAAEWIKKREAEIEQHPEILTQGRKHTVPTLKEAVEKYIAEANSMGRSKKFGLLFITSFAIGQKPITRISRTDYAEHIRLRREGSPKEGIKPISASTALQELQYIRTVLKHAFYVWNIPVSWQELDFAAEGLAGAKIIGKSKRRDRLPTNGELQALTDFFYRRWQHPRHSNHVPMHLIMWLAIYTCRREGEISRLLLDDYHPQTAEWLMRDVKHPDGSEGNHKWFTVPAAALPVIDALLEAETRRRMLTCNGIANSLVPISGKTVGTAFQRACKVLGIADLRFHDLRHEGATRLAEDGLTVPQIQKITLHDSWGSLQRYVNTRRRGERLDFQAALEQAQKGR